MKDNKQRGQVTTKVPVKTYLNKTMQILERVSPNWSDEIEESAKCVLDAAGTKLEPVIQIYPHSTFPTLIGFEALGIGSYGENFSQLCKMIDRPSVLILKVILMMSAFVTIQKLRTEAALGGISGARHLVGTVNLDPETLKSEHIGEILDAYREVYEDGKILFEVSETTSFSCLDRLKQLQVDYDLRLCADDINRWKKPVLEALIERVEITKLDAKGFQKLMKKRGNVPDAVIEMIAKYQVGSKPLIVEGIQEKGQWRFLENHWGDKVGTCLFGQGYAVSPGPLWDQMTTDLKSFGLEGGYIF